MGEVPGGREKRGQGAHPEVVGSTLTASFGPGTPTPTPTPAAKGNELSPSMHTCSSSAHRHL